MDQTANYLLEDQELPSRFWPVVAGAGGECDGGGGGGDDPRHRLESRYRWPKRQWTWKPFYKQLHSFISRMSNWATVLNFLIFIEIAGIIAHRSRK